MRTAANKLIGTLIGKRIRALRIARGLGVNELARLIGSHGPVVSRTELGKHTLSLDGIGLYARALEVPAEAIVQALDAVDPRIWLKLRGNGDEPKAKTGKRPSAKRPRQEGGYHHQKLSSVAHLRVPPLRLPHDVDFFADPDARRLGGAFPEPGPNTLRTRGGEAD